MNIYQQLYTQLKNNKNLIHLTHHLRMIFHPQCLSSNVSVSEKDAVMACNWLFDFFFQVLNIDHIDIDLLFWTLWWLEWTLIDYNCIEGSTGVGTHLTGSICLVTHHCIGELSYKVVIFINLHWIHFDYLYI